MSIGAIQRIDSNRAAQPRLPTAMRIARALDVSIESLLA
jgi:transcriptional regulator with XRE-family HTH domain